MKRLFVLALIVFWPAIAAGQFVQLPKEVKGAPGSWIIVAPEKLDGGQPEWEIDPGLQEVRLDLLLPPEFLTKLKGKVVSSNKAGRYMVTAWNAKGDTASKLSRCIVVVGDPGPGPVPPEPGPGPKPPEPKPPEPPTPAPIDADGLHVLIIFETEDKVKLSAGQFDIIYGMEMRQWLKANCAADQQTNDKKAYWMLDKDEVNLPELDKKWRDAMKRPRQSVPWIIVSNRSKGGYEGPLPADTAAAIKLLEKYK